MRLLIACDKFKGSLGALGACEALQEGLLAGGLEAEIDLCPIADGGEGFTEAMVAAMGGRWRSCRVPGPLGTPVEAEFGICQRGEQTVAVMEMAAASGMWRLSRGERDIMRATTSGTGRLIRQAVKLEGASEILIGLGGSATNDGGVGMAAALGIAFRDKFGWELEPVPEGLDGLCEICEGGRMRVPRIEVACDVDNPLLGPSGATAVYGPQKGAGPEELERLERILERLVEVSRGQELAQQPGAGAAGGLGFGLMRFADATLRPGFDMVADALQLDERIKAVDAVITGEGSLDGQTLSGKGPAGVARMAREAGAMVIGIGGRVTDEVRESGLFDQLGTLEAFKLPLEESMRRGGELLGLTGRKLVGLLRDEGAS